MLQSLKTLSNFSIAHNRFSGEAPTIHCAPLPPPGLGVEDGKNSQMYEFRFRNNSFTGDAAKILQALGPCDSPDSPVFRYTIDISLNRISGQLPGNLFMTPKLQEFRGDGNDISGPIAKRKKLNCSSLQTLSLSGNRLSGPIPSPLLWACTNLVNLDLSRNRLSGSIPSPASKSKSKTASAEPTGVPSLEAEAGHQGQGTGLLEHFPWDVQRAEEAGTGDASEEASIQLQVLNLSHNDLSGPVPSALRRMALLLNLDLSANKLSGPLPRQIAQMPLLLGLNLSSNNLSGQ